jgi:hypothetical protein
MAQGQLYLTLRPVSQEKSFSEISEFIEGIA